MQCQSHAEQLFFTTVRVDTVLKNGSSGSGTSFLFLYQKDKMTFPFIVTNKHVVDAVSGSLTFHRGKDDAPQLGECIRVDFQDWSNNWHGHPSPDVDIAVSPFLPIEKQIQSEQGIEIFRRMVLDSMMPTSAQISDLDAIEPVTFIGYPNGVWDSKNFLPVARRGTTATPIAVDFEGTPRFLIDASVFGGSSGSPVFIIDQGAYCDKRGNTIVGASRLLFVGVIAEVFVRTQLSRIISVPIPTHFEPMAVQHEMIDLGIVFKPQTVVETIESFMLSKGI